MGLSGLIISAEATLGSPTMKTREGVPSLALIRQKSELSVLIEEAEALIGLEAHPPDKMQRKSSWELAPKVIMEREPNSLNGAPTTVAKRVPSWAAAATARSEAAFVELPAISVPSRVQPLSPKLPSSPTLSELSEELQEGTEMYTIGNICFTAG